MKTQTATHTPTPWVIIQRDPEQTDYKAEIHGHGGDSYPVAYLTGISEDKANAAFIVRAVNSHEELLSFSKAYRDELNKKGYSNDALLAIDEAIAKAEAGR